MLQQFSKTNYQAICDELASNDPDLKKIINTHGYPPFWSRPNSFESLVHIILEQQVSLASALSALNKLKERVQELTPARVLLLTDEEFRACYCSRQKTTYIKYLAEALLSGQLKLEEFHNLPDDEIRAQLVALKGIGNWTANYALMKTFHYPEAFPLEDAGVHNAIKNLKKMKVKPTLEQVKRVFKKYKGWEAYATLYLWKSL